MIFIIVVMYFTTHKLNVICCGTFVYKVVAITHIAAS